MVNKRGKKSGKPEKTKGKTDETVFKLNIKIKSSVKPWQFALGLAVVYFVINLILAIHHEPWFEEGNAWGLAKSLGFGNFFEVLKDVAYPPLWFIILAPFAKIGLPYFTANIISLLISTLAVFLLAYKAPFGKFTKILLILSSAFLYLIPAFTTGYCLIALGIVLVCINYNNRLEKPLVYALSLAVLSQASFLCLGLSAGLAALFLIEFFGHQIFAKAYKKLLLLLPILAIFAVSALLFLPSLLSTVSESPFLAQTVESWKDLGKTLSKYDNNLFGVAFPVLEISLAVVALYFLLSAPKLLLVMLCAFGGFAYIGFFRYSFGFVPALKLAVLPLFFVLLAWLVRLEHDAEHPYLEKITGRFELYKFLKKSKAVAYLPLLPVLVTIPHTINLAIEDFHEDFNSSKVVAEVINDYPEDSVIITSSDAMAGYAMAFQPLLKDGRKLYDAGLDRPLEYYTNDEEDHTVASQEQFEAVLEKLARTENSQHLFFITRLGGCNGETPADGVTVGSDWQQLAVFNQTYAKTDYVFAIYLIR